jgi:aldehyde dehydrogenase (NAD+)
MYRNEVDSIFSELLLGKPIGSYDVKTPIDGTTVGGVEYATNEQTFLAYKNSVVAFKQWKDVPAPKRGELIRIFGNKLRQNKLLLGRLVTIETGKILQEGLGEVQEMIDICDFAVGLSRQLYGLTVPSERANHRLLETWHPLGPVAVISAFNFPVAVWAWNFALAIVCGNSVIWKPSEKSPLTAIACQKIFKDSVKEFDGTVPDNLSQVVIGDHLIGNFLINQTQIKLVSATGSTRMGEQVAYNVASRLGRYLLELGGNNGMIVTPSADISMAVKAAVFGAVGTAGQRCTTLRRLFVHADVYDAVVASLRSAYSSISVGNPLDKKTLVGPIIDEYSYETMQHALEEASNDGGTIHGGDPVIVPGCERGYYVNPALVEMPSQAPVVFKETFAPILYVMKYYNFDKALEDHNAVSQGLSSCIFSNDIRETEKFLLNSDCGIANVNVGPSGAEISLSFGGEKDTGGGRESGTDSWKSYMRRQSTTVNFGDDLPLAQGISFNL